MNPSKKYELELDYVRRDYDEKLHRSTFGDYCFTIWEVDDEIGRINGESLYILHDLINDTLKIEFSFGHELYDEGRVADVLARLNNGWLKDKLNEICFDETD
jgi:hypothetical protein